MESFSPDPAQLEVLSRLDAHEWSGEVWRYTFGSHPPDRTNTRGARWNPPGVEALYASLEQRTARAESDHLLGTQPIPPRTTRVVHRLNVRLEAVLDLRDPQILEALGVSVDEMLSDDHRTCQAIGGAAAFLGIDGLLVPSARADGGTNLVILFSAAGPWPVIETVASEPVTG